MDRFERALKEVREGVQGALADFPDVEPDDVAHDVTISLVGANGYPDEVAEWVLRGELGLADEFGDRAYIDTIIPGRAQRRADRQRRAAEAEERAWRRVERQAAREEAAEARAHEAEVRRDRNAQVAQLQARKARWGQIRRTV